ncbi:MAG: hypothetical protein ABJD07_03610 [Gemmatimonadaceae bacterium]
MRLFPSYPAALALGCAPLLLIAAVACHSRDALPASVYPNLNFAYYGTENLGAATCIPPATGGPGDTAPFTAQRLLSFTQTDSIIVGRDEGDRAVHFTGIASASGTVTLDGLASGIDPSQPANTVTIHWTYNLQALAGGDELRATGQVTMEIRNASTGALIRSCVRSIVSDFTKRTAAVPELTAIPCSQEPSVASQTTMRGSALLIFENSSNSRRAIIWIDYQGRRINALELGPGEVASVSTYVTHPWLVADATNGQCGGIYQPVVGPAIVAIR